MSCAEAGDELVEYSIADDTTNFDFEELSLEMLYRDRKSFAVGHGCAADWDDGDGGGALSVSTALIRA